MKTYTIYFSGTMYHEAESADEAYAIMQNDLSEIASDFQIEVVDNG